MRRRNRLKDNYFKESSGLLIRRQLATYSGGPTANCVIFTEEEVKKATNNYHEAIGEGAYATIYKGLLPDNTVVAVKKLKTNCPPSHSNQFVNEVIIYSQINHRNVVRLLGCCLETPTPVLVLEYMNNGTLYDHVHKKHRGEPLLVSWELRMKIVAEIAGALAYLHYSTSMQVIHRDVKATNIMLDHNYKAKLIDFGSARLVPEDQDELSTLVMGTLGYLDPEYLQSHTLTEKSDVYGFGVVLAELLTGRQAFSFEKPEKERNLANFFVCLVEEGRLDQILDSEIVKEENFESVKKVADLAKRCLSLIREERPSMREVAMRLEGLRIMAKHPELKLNFFPSDPKETDSNANSSGSGEGDNGG